jgi:hypothetical protein
MTGPKSYRPWSPDHPFLLPPDPREWLPKDHLAHFVLEVVDALDIAAIEDAIQDKDPRGERPYAPRMMLAILVYGYCTGTFSSRRMERRTYEDGGALRSRDDASLRTESRCPRFGTWPAVSIPSSRRSARFDGTISPRSKGRSSRSCGSASGRGSRSSVMFRSTAAKSTRTPANTRR